MPTLNLLLEFVPVPSRIYCSSHPLSPSSSPHLNFEAVVVVIGPDHPFVFFLDIILAVAVASRRRQKLVIFGHIRCLTSTFSCPLKISEVVDTTVDTAVDTAGCRRRDAPSLPPAASPHRAPPTETASSCAKRLHLVVLASFAAVAFAENAGAWFEKISCSYSC